MSQAVIDALWAVSSEQFASSQFRSAWGEPPHPTNAVLVSGSTALAMTDSWSSALARNDMVVVAASEYRRPPSEGSVFEFLDDEGEVVKRAQVDGSPTQDFGYYLLVPVTCSQ